MKIKLLQTNKEKEECIKIAENLPEWFNENGIKAIKEDLEKEETFIILDNEKVLGFITVKPLNKDSLEILWLAIKREFRGKGLGTKLLDFIEKWAKKQGFKVISVKTSGDLSYKPYEETRKFYEKKGFNKSLKKLFY